MTWLKLLPWGGDPPNFSSAALPCCHSELLLCSLTPLNEGSWGSPDFSPEMCFFVAESLFLQSEITAKSRFFILQSLSMPTFYVRENRCFYPEDVTVHMYLFFRVPSPFYYEGLRTSTLCSLPLPASSEISTDQWPTIPFLLFFTSFSTDSFVFISI